MPKSTKSTTKKGRSGTRARLTVERKKAFIETYRKTGRSDLAAVGAGVERTTPYLWAKKDEQFKQDWADSEPFVAELLEAEAIKRANAGSDTLLIFLMKGFRPEKYRERYDFKSKVDMTTNAKASDLTDDQLAEIILKGDKDG